jgi:hypothetical protein
MISVLAGAAPTTNSKREISYGLFTTTLRPDV